MDPQDVVGMCDENTICVVPIQGVTITGLNDNVKEINDALDKLNAEKDGKYVFMWMLLPVVLSIRLSIRIPFGISV